MMVDLDIDFRVLDFFLMIFPNKKKETSLRSLFVADSRIELLFDA